MYCYKKLYHLDPNSLQYWNCRAFSSLHSNLQLSLSAALKGAYNMPLLELVYNPRQFGENQLVSITTWLSLYSAPVCISWKLMFCLYFFPSLPFTLVSIGLQSHHACLEMPVNGTTNLTPLTAENWNVWDMTVLNINPLLWINLYCSSGLYF